MQPNTTQHQAGEPEFDLRSYLRILLRRKQLIFWFATSLTVLVGAGTAFQPKVYEAKATVLAGRDAPRLLNYDPLPQERFREREVMRTQAAILTSRSFLQRVAERLLAEGFFGNPNPSDREEKLAELARMLQVQTEARTYDDSQVITIVVSGGVPDRVARIADSIAEAYVDYVQENRQSMANQAVAWLDTKLEEQRTRLTQAQSALQAFKDKENITARDEEDPFSTLSLTRLNEEYLTTRIQRMERETRLQALRKPPRSRGSPGVSPAKALELDVRATLRDRLKKDYVDAQLELRSLSERYGPEHPDLITLKGKISKIEAELQSLEEPESTAAAPPEPPVSETRLAELQAEYNGLLSREKALAQALDASKAAARNLSRTAVRYSLLKQEVDLNQETYNLLSTRLNDARLSSQIRNPSVMVLDRAEPPRSPVEPQPARNLVVAVMLGLVLGVGLALLLENLDRRVKSPEDVARYLQLPLLTVVPGVGLAKGVGREEGKAKLVTVEEPRSHVAECYRNLRTSILFSSGRPVPKSILVTSAVAGEGKSTTAANLAVVMSQSGRRVVLIDADLRRPSQHRYFVRQGNRGLIRLLKESCAPGEAVQRSGIENLDVLLCHGIPHNPSELLGSPAMQAAIDALKEAYDVVIIDSPVVISVPDAVILASWSEAVLLIHRPGAADREIVRAARERLSDVKANILGLVLNNVDMKEGQYYYPEHSYYGYGTEEEKRSRQRTS
jgi:capsular exopolysaccharide synthesis family protein